MEKLLAHPVILQTSWAVPKKWEYDWDRFENENKFHQDSKFHLWLHLIKKVMEKERFAMN